MTQLYLWPAYAALTLILTLTVVHYADGEPQDHYYLTFTFQIVYAAHCIGWHMG